MTIEVSRPAVDTDKSVTHDSLYPADSVEIGHKDLRQIRTDLGIPQRRFARALGYRDADAYRKYEAGLRPVPPLLAKLMLMIKKHGLPPEWDKESNRDR